MLTPLANPPVTILLTNVGFYGSVTSKIVKPGSSFVTNAYILRLISIVPTPVVNPPITILAIYFGFYGSVNSMIFKPALLSATNA